MGTGETPEEGIDWGTVQADAADVFGAESRRCKAPGCDALGVALLVGNEDESDVPLCLFHVAHQAFLLGADCTMKAGVAMSLASPLAVAEFGRSLVAAGEELGRRVVLL